MMRAQLTSLPILLIFCFNLITDAFLTPQPRAAFASILLQSEPSSSFERNSDDKSAPNTDSYRSSIDAGTATISSTAQLDSELLTEVRLELVEKYLNQGFTQEVAEQEVDIFLQDKERSEKYLEMRMYAALQADDLGIGFGLQLFGGFLVGFIGIAGPKYYQAYKAIHPEGTGPLPFL
jgi:hypothetical protein